MEKVKIVIFISFISLFGLWHIWQDDLYFSDHENRVLQSFPTLSFTSVRTGKFMDSFETYVADQFPLRNGWVGVKGKAERLSWKKENNDIMFGRDGYLFGSFTMNEEQASENIKAINDFVKQNESLQVGFMLAPTSISIYPEKLPRFAETGSERAAIDSLYSQLDNRAEKLAVTELLLKQKDEPIYFRTDHHWTMLGAYEGYVRAGDVFGFDVLGREAFFREHVSDDFYGSFYARANDFSVRPDVMEYLRPVDEPEVRVVFDDGSEMDSLVLEEALDSRDKYRFFLGGNHGLVRIESDVNNGRKLLVVKDSYAHVLVPFFVHHYEEIHMIDLRYFRQFVGDYAADVGVDDVLIMYNVANFVDDLAVKRIAYE